MLDGFPLVDVHLHAASKPTLKLPWDTWVQGFAAATSWTGSTTPPAP